MLEQLERAFKIATDAGCVDTIMCKEVENLLEAIKKVTSEFKDGIKHADAIIYKIWDLGGQGVRSRMLTPISTRSSCHSAITLARVLSVYNHATLHS